MKLTRRQMLVLGSGLVLPVSGAGSARAQASATNRVNVRDFGARGDGIADDTRAIQAAIDHALQARKVAVHLPAGRYRTTDTLHLGYGDDFTTLALEGEGAPSYAGHSAGAVILPERIDRPALNIQGARDSAVRNICIVGRNFAYGLEKTTSSGARKGDYIGVADPVAANWLAPALRGGLKPFAPYAGITIDAYAAPPRPDSYPPPPFPSWKARAAVPEARRFSSHVEIANCWLGGFGVCIAVQPCDADGNGDFLRVSGTTFYASAYGIAVGNAQSRNVAIRDCIYTYLHTFVTNRHFGRGIGMMGGPIENVGGNASYQMLDLLAARAGPVIVSSAYFEAHSRIGVWSNNSDFNPAIEFQSCFFNLGEDLLEVATGALLECGAKGTVRFSGCTFQQAQRIFHPVRGASRVELNACMVGQVMDFRDPDFYRTQPPWLARALDYACGGIFLDGEVLSGRISLTAGLGLDFENDGAKATTRERGPLIAPAPGRRALVHHYATALRDRNGMTWPIRWRPRPIAIDKRPGFGPLRSLAYGRPDVLVLMLDVRGRRGRDDTFGPGDILYDVNSATVLAVSTVQWEGDLCTVQALQLNNLRTRGGVSAASVDVVASGGYLWRYDANIMVGDQVLFGNFTAGSPLVRHVHDGSGAFAGIAASLVPGDWLAFTRSGPPMAPGAEQPLPYGPDTRIVAVDETEGTVLLSRPATGTARHLVSPVILG